MGNQTISSVLARARAYGARRRRHSRREVQRSGRLERSVVEFYRGTDAKDGLFALSEPGRTRSLAVYSPPSWRLSGQPGVPETMLLPKLSPIETAGRTRDKRNDIKKPSSIVRREKLVGTVLWDGDALVTCEMPVGYAGSIVAKPTGYYDIGGRMVALEEEAVRHAQGRARRMGQHRAVADQFSTIPRGLGGIVLLGVESSHEVKVLVHQRSEDVATAPGAWCATPTYIVEDPKSAGRVASTVGLALYNVLRETLEEAYGFPDLRLPSTRIDTDWFLRAGIGRELNEGVIDGTVRPIHLGWSVNLVSGQLDMITFLLVSGNDELSNRILREVDTSSDEVFGLARWIILDSPELSDMIFKPTFHGGSAVAVHEARQYMAARP